MSPLLWLYLHLAGIRMSAFGHTRTSAETNEPVPCVAARLVRSDSTCPQPSSTNRRAVSRRWRCMRQTVLPVSRSLASFVVAHSAGEPRPPLPCRAVRKGSCSASRWEGCAAGGPVLTRPVGGRHEERKRVSPRVPEGRGGGRECRRGCRVHSHGSPAERLLSAEAV